MRFWMIHTGLDLWFRCDFDVTSIIPLSLLFIVNAAANGCVFALDKWPDVRRSPRFPVNWCILGIFCVCMCEQTEALIIRLPLSVKLIAIFNLISELEFWNSNHLDLWPDSSASTNPLDFKWPNPTRLCIRPDLAGRESRISSSDKSPAAELSAVGSFWLLSMKWTGHLLGWLRIANQKDARWIR